MRPQMFAILVGIAMLACREEPSGLSSARGVKLDLALSSTYLSRGQPDTLTMTVTNTSPRLVVLTGGVCEPRPYVTNSQGQVVVPAGGQWPCVLSLRKLQLAPGERFIRVFVWDTSAEVVDVYAAAAVFTSEEVQLETPQHLVHLN
jgi:hypothetical protein